MNECRKARRLLVLRAADRNAGEQAFLEAHLQDCPRCAAWAQQCQEQDALIGTLPRMRPSLSQEQRFLANLHNERGYITMFGRLTKILSAAAFVAVLVLLGIITRTLLPTSLPDQDSSPASSGEPLPTLTLSSTSTPVTPTPVPSPTVPPAPTKQTMPSPTSTPDSGATGAQLPAPLYYFTYASCNNVKAVWRITSEGLQTERILPENISVSALDVWSGDGRVAYGTGTGAVYVAMPGEEPQRVYQASTEGTQAVINCVKWSPGGTRLAYCVNTDNGSQAIDNPEWVAQESGLWILTLENNVQVQLLKNRYWDKNDIENVNVIRIIREVAWSPDEQAMIVKTNHWEWYDIYWLYPLEPSPDEANLHDPEGLGWDHGNWANEGQDVLLSGLEYSSANNVVRVGRQSMEHTTLVDGEQLQVKTVHAQGLADKIVFFMQSQSGRSIQTRLYLGQQDDTGFTYAPAGPENLLCDAVSDVKWDSTGQWAALTCGSTLQVISLDGATDIDLTSTIAPLTSCTQDNVRSQVFWGTPDK